MLCMDPGNCKEWKDAPGDSPEFSADGAHKPRLICHSAASNQRNQRHPPAAEQEEAEKSQVVYFEMWASVLEAWASHLSH